LLRSQCSVMCPLLHLLSVAAWSRNLENKSFLKVVLRVLADRLDIFSILPVVINSFCPLLNCPLIEVMLLAFLAQAV